MMVLNVMNAKMIININLIIIYSDFSIILMMKENVSTVIFVQKVKVINVINVKKDIILLNMEEFVQQKKIVIVEEKILEFALIVKMNFVQISKMENVNQIKKIMIFNFVDLQKENVLNVFMAII